MKRIPPFRSLSLPLTISLSSCSPCSLLPSRSSSLNAQRPQQRGKGKASAFRKHTGWGLCLAQVQREEEERRWSLCLSPSLGVRFPRSRPFVPLARRLSVCLSLSRVLITLLPLRSISPLLLTSCKQMQIALLRPKIASDRRKLASSFLVSLVLFLPPLFLPSLPQIPREAKDYWTKGERCCERTNTTTRAKAPRQPPS